MEIENNDNIEVDSTLPRPGIDPVTSEMKTDVQATRPHR